jgi:hypothetical protein
MQMREKIITAVCRTADGLEWTSLKAKSDGTESLFQESAQIPISGESSEEIIASIELPNEIAEQIKGDIIVPLRTSELLMRVMELPATDASEITDMVQFQVDKISPFPVDQIAISHEVLQQSEDTSLVLMVAAKRSCIDALGDTFKDQGVRIHSIDSRLLGWLKLMTDNGHVSEQGCEILIINDDVDFSLVIIDAGTPIAFRMLHAQLDNENLVEELADEIQYTLTTLDTERDLPTPSAIQFWSHGNHSQTLRADLSEKVGLKIHPHALDSLPPLSEGIVRRALSNESHVELIPREWVDHEKRKQLQKKSILYASIVTGIWLIILLSFVTVYKVRDVKLNAAQKRADDIKPAAEEALDNRKKLNTLKVYTDRSDSALECLREATRQLPSGDIEFVSYNYNKGKGVTLRGTASNDNMIDDYFIKLAKSPLFVELKNQSSSSKTTKGVRRQVFSVTLVLSSEEDAK